ncbi:hypothetical protein BCR33DRAFT_781132 [Rhizoclosmatium globosum]|uniref:Uncharacterized protein n=1 Tax=Rhizoclosmatium globosum TaxID=329046 RepID=A0A1Y2CTN1_9FUNG|nr:hypothetical protein BCR33DRAFT_781132 [Rhizoclosmatium globosum]|eukprot:ORY50399.1 hypothetical protein BCR33DRAFT_781132 [Rhizoclosmatium globosum]
MPSSNTTTRPYASQPETSDIFESCTLITLSPPASMSLFEKALSFIGLVKQSRLESVVSELETATATILQVTERFTEQHNKTTDYSNSLQIKFDALSAKYSTLDSHSAELETTKTDRICRDTAAAHNQEIENQEIKRLEISQEHSRTYNVAANQTNSLQTKFDALSTKYSTLDSHSAELEKTNQELIRICRDTAAAHNQEIENQEKKLELAQEHSRTSFSATENAAALEASEYAITSKLDKYYQDQLADKDKEYMRLESEMTKLRESCTVQMKSLTEVHTVKVTTLEIEVQRLARLPKTVKLTFDAEKQELRVMNKELTKGLAMATEKIDTLSGKTCLPPN